MCGIAGIISPRGEASLPLILAMRDAMTHRGPDSAGAWADPECRVALGHRRLSIVDLTPGGHQPMVDAETGCVVVFNGEIYNYRDLRAQLAATHPFRSESDTEVLLAAYRRWGPDFVAQLGGMFAFAIWDPREQWLFAARDRAGEKPFYYRHDAAGLRFASELKSLMADPAFERRVDSEALRSFLELGYVAAPRSILVGVNKLPPAHTLTFRAATGECVVRRYWTPPVLSPSADGASAGELTERLEKLLGDSVRRQLVADVPVGILLSGGIDSSLVTALAVRSGAKPIKTFTMTFPGFGRFNEAPFAAEIARHFGTEHHELEAKPAALDVLPRLAAQFDEPMVDSSMIPTFLVSQLIRGHAKVALGGDGGDELFGGYSIYARLNFLAQANAIVALPKAWKRSAATALLRCYGRGLRGRNYLPALLALIDGRPPDVRRLLFDEDVTALLGPARKPANEATDGVVTEGTLIDRLCRTDFSGYLVEDILTKVDRASMLASLEVRAPWLDQAVIEFAFGSVPDRLKTTWSQRKVLPKLLARRLFPAGYDFRRKQGFSLPFAAWFQQGSDATLHEIIRENPVPAFSPVGIEHALADGRRGANPERIFGLALFALWCRHYRVAF